MINPKDKFDRPAGLSFIPRVLDGGLNLDIERLSQTMAMLEDYVDNILAMDDPPSESPSISDEDLRLRVASL